MFCVIVWYELYEPGKHIAPYIMQRIYRIFKNYRRRVGLAYRPFPIWGFYHKINRSYRVAGPT
jgi:hypothetical protein